MLSEGGSGKITVRDTDNAGGDDRPLEMEVSGIKVKIGSAVHVVGLASGKHSSEIDCRTAAGKRKTSVGS